ncbi:MAG: DUF45 domain-containing protein [Candidatus Aenigmarchaeota archaeon]|nr:M48 family metallopeptidase [Candidatus Aenigmarchaeota archaeon]MDW8149184.1 DUF45 domain-containing protein [Candidatus Aenigmarchaeota archaeon]
MKESSKPLRVTSKIGSKKITYFVIKRNVKYPRLEFRGNFLCIVVPKDIKNFRYIIEKKEKWILNKLDFINKILERNKNLTNKFIIFGVPTNIEKFQSNLLSGNKNKVKIRNFLRHILFQKIKNIAEEYSKKFGIKYNKIFIRNQKTKWASCSSKKNLSFNIKILSLPEALINYLVLHEILHLKEKKHSENFILMIKKEFPNYKEIEEQLTNYWFILNNNYWWKNFS